MSPKPKRNPFAGDATHRLPAGMREHYRLWFEFLKLAHRDPHLKDKIDKVFYAPWGEVASDDFDKWWDRHWRDLFGVPLSVVEITAPSALDALGNQRMMLSIDPNAGLEKTLKEVKDLIVKRTQGSPRKKSALIEQGRFALSGNVEVKRLNMQQALKFYELSLQTSDLGEIVHRYLKWARAWNEKIKGDPSSNKPAWNRSRINIPDYIEFYAREKQKGDAQKAEATRRATVERRTFEKPIARQRLLHSTGIGNTDDDRRPIRRLLQRARKIAENTARGEFPGEY